MKYLLQIIIIIPLFLGFWLLIFLIKHPCIKSHQEHTFVPAHTYYIMVGKILVPQHQESYWSTVEVCDKRK